MNFLHYISLVLFSLFSVQINAKSSCDSMYYSQFIFRANQFQIHHQHQKVAVLVDSILTWNKEDENCKFVLILLNLKALAYEHSQKFEECSKISTEVVALAQKYQFPEIEARAYLTLVRMHDFLKREGDLKRNLSHVKALIDRYNLQEFLPEYYVRASSSQRFFGKQDSSLYYAKQAVVWGEKFNDYLNLADGHLLIGANYRGTEKSTQSMLTSCEYFKKLGSNSSVALQYINVIKSLNSIGRMKETNQYIDSSKLYLRNLEKTPRVYDIHEYLYELVAQKFEQEGSLDSSIFYIKLAHMYSDSSLFVTNYQYITDKEIEIATLKEKALVHQLSRSRSYWISGFVLLSFCILAVSYLYINRLKYQKKITHQTEEILAQKNELDILLARQNILLSEIHHRVKNNLQVVISLLTLKGQRSSNQETENFFEDICLKIRSISLIHEQLYNSNQFDNVNVGLYVQQLIDGFNNITSKSENTFTVNIPTLYFNIETLFPIGIILTELIMNSIKHAEIESGKSLSINISINEVDNGYLLRYSDNGKGKSSDHKGLGTTILHAMSRQLNANSTEFNQAGFNYQLTFTQKTTSS